MEAATPQRIDILQLAPTGRARCRACGAAIEKGVLRFGEALESAYGEGDATTYYWFHPRCAAHRRPEKFAVVAREASDETLFGRAALLAEAEEGITHERLPRVAGAELAPSGRARCRHCKELIAQGLWRVRLSAFGQSGFFEPLGFVHAACARVYFGVPSLRARLEQSSPGVDPAALAPALAAIDVD
ncbi:MAG TPA: hypothetical protein VGG33_14175 [Polyangia bacterium]